MKRVEAARASLLGLEVLSLPLLAARLAGGFRRFADRDLLAPAIAEALGKGISRISTASRTCPEWFER